MGALQDFLADVNNYPDGNVELQIQLMPSGSLPGEEPDTALNDGETRQYRIKVDNKGNLNMNNLKLFVEGSKWADVSSSTDGPFASDFISPAQDVGARAIAMFGPFVLKATQKTNNGPKKLVKTHVRTADYDLDFILTGFRHESELPEATLDDEVFPS